MYPSYGSPLAFLMSRYKSRLAPKLSRFDYGFFILYLQTRKISTSGPVYTTVEKSNGREKKGVSQL